MKVGDLVIPVQGLGCVLLESSGNVANRVDGKIDYSVYSLAFVIDKIDVGSGKLKILTNIGTIGWIWSNWVVKL